MNNQNNDIKSEKLVEHHVFFNMRGFVDTDEFWEVCPETEVLETWAVSENLAYLLEKHGEPIMRVNAAHVWGRQISGQRIMLDAVIQDIAAKYEYMS